jgi:hypothetical protein
MKTLKDSLEKAWKGGISLQSQFFRDNPRQVALAASLGFITTLDPIGNYGGVWRITPTGCFQLFNPTIDKELYESQFHESNESPGVDS